MAKDWKELSDLTQAHKIVVERVRLVEKDVTVEGAFELPPLANLTTEDQVFVTAFLRTHGSIKEMEQLFGVSYPTIKNRLNRIAEQLEYVELNVPAAPTHKTILDKLERGEISPSQALEQMKK